MIRAGLLCRPSFRQSLRRLPLPLRAQGETYAVQQGSYSLKSPFLVAGGTLCHAGFNRPERSGAMEKQAFPFFLD